MNAEYDDIILRLRDADPAAALDPRAALDRRAVTRVRRRRAAARGGAVAAVAVAVTAAFSLVPGGSGSPDVVARAVAASELPPRSIVAITSDVDVASTGTLHERRTTWIRLSGDSRPLAVRTLLVDASGGSAHAGAEDVTTTGPDGRSTLQQYDPATGNVTTTPDGSQSPPLVFQAHALLVRAQAGDRTIRIAGEETVAGRRAYRLIVTGADEPAGPGERDELLVDAETYAPLELRMHDEGLDVHGRPFVYDYTERVVERRTLPDTEANRRLLRLHGGD